MSRRLREKLNSRPVESLLIKKEENSTGNGNSTWLPSDYPPQSLKIKGSIISEISSLSIDYQLTVRPKVELTRYQISMILETLLYEVSEIGISFTSYLILEFLYSSLLGNKQILELRSGNERRTLFLAQILLRSIRGIWFSLEDREKIPEKLIRDLREIRDLFPSLREYSSRRTYWNCGRFLEVRAVRLDVFLERRDNSERYSSYCKGYGESSQMGHRRKTRTSAELDGEDNDRPEIVFDGLEIVMLLDLVRLDIQQEERRKREKR